MLTVSDKETEKPELTNQTAVPGSQLPLSPSNTADIDNEDDEDLEDEEDLEDDDEDFEDDDEDFDDEDDDEFDDDEDEEFDDEDDEDFEDDDEEYEDDEDEDEGGYQAQLSQSELFSQLASNPLFAQVSQMLGGMGSPTDQLLTQARFMQGSGDLEGAAQIYLDVIEQDGENFRAYESLGQVLMMMDRNQEAETFLQKAVDLDPNAASAYLYLGYAHYAQDQYEKSVADFRRSLELDPQNPLVANNLGYAQYLLGDFEGAAQTFSDAGDYGSDRAYYNLGMIRLLQGRAKEAADAYQEGLDLDPQRRQVEDHLEDLEKAAEKHPDQAAALKAQVEKLRAEL